MIDPFVFFLFLMVTDLSRGHIFPLEKWHHVACGFTRLPYFCMFLVWLLLLLGVEQLEKTLKPLDS